MLNSLWYYYFYIFCCCCFHSFCLLSLVDSDFVVLYVICARCFSLSYCCWLFGCCCSCCRCCWFACECLFTLYIFFLSYSISHIWVQLMMFTCLYCTAGDYATGCMLLSSCSSVLHCLPASHPVRRTTEEMKWIEKKFLYLRNSNQINMYILSELDQYRFFMLLSFLVRFFIGPMELFSDGWRCFFPWFW